MNANLDAIGRCRSEGQSVSLLRNGLFQNQGEDFLFRFDGRNKERMFVVHSGEFFQFCFRNSSFRRFVNDLLDKPDVFKERL